MTTIHQILRMIDGRDPAGVFLLALVMLLLGTVIGRNHEAADRIGSYAAVFASAFYVVYACIAYGRWEPASILGITWCTLEAAAITYGLAAVATAAFKALVVFPAKTITHWINIWMKRLRDGYRGRRRRREEQARRQAAADRTRALAPLREQAGRDAEAARRERARLDELRRNLRFECELAYNRLRPAVVKMFPKKEFARLVEDALAAAAADELRRAADELMDTVRAVVGHAAGGGVKSLMDVATDFDQRRLAVQNASFSDQRKDDLIKYLNLQEEIEIRRRLEQ